ncbi:MAG: CHAD domain-containing protein [Sinimarinibacterium sp.]|jgi:CHAD domain-containing protein
MAFALASDQPLRDTLLQVAVSECERALEHLQRGKAEDIHETRKSIKRLRAWLRLLRPDLGERYDTLNALLRDAAGALGGRRDRDVARETLRSLRRGRLLTATQYGALLPLIDEALHDAAHVAKANADARRLLKAAGVYLQSLELPELDDASLAERLAHNRARCRRRWRQACKRPTAEALHEWRKTVKHLTTQAALLAPRLPGADAGVGVGVGVGVATLKDLGETLGRHHDHHQLALQLRVEELPDTDLLRLRLHDALRRRLLQLEQQALRQGGTLFS